ncbi:radical SAM protein [Amycolatopsis balhimycina]|nr:radical SAM protein [Amycolatopsis balhimycina]
MTRRTGLLLLENSGGRLHLVPLDALRSVLLLDPGPAHHRQRTAECTALPSGQAMWVDLDEISPHVVPDRAVADVLTAFGVTGLQPADSPMLPEDRRATPFFGNLVDPDWLSVSLGGKCDSRCVFCFTEWIRHQPSLTFDQAIRALDEAASIAGLETVVFTGGEPTIRKDLPELVRHASGNGFKVVGLQTNGHRLAEPAYLDEILDAGVATVLLSLHGVRSETHDGIARRKGSFALALEALRAMSDRGKCLVSVNFVVCRENAHEAESLPDLVHGVAPAAEIRYSFPIVEGAAYDNVETTLPPLPLFADLVARARSRTTGTISVANVPPCVSSKLGLANTYALRQRRSMLAVSPFAALSTPRGEMSAKLEACHGCRFSDDCTGLQLAYLRRFPEAHRHIDTPSP